MSEADDDALYDVIVVGNGLFGAAAARYLSGGGAAEGGSETTAAGLRVLVIGAVPPPNGDGDGDDGDVFEYSSHADAGRLVHTRYDDTVWTTLAARSVRAFPALERASGVRFHRPCGHTHVITDGARAAAARREAAHSSAQGVVTFHDGAAEADDDAPPTAAAARPHPPWHPLVFPRQHAVVHERAPAGCVDPRALIRAQNAVARAHGARFVEARATRVTAEEGGTGVRVHFADGGTRRAAKVLLACGVFTQALLAASSLSPSGASSASQGALLSPASLLPLRIKTESVIVARVASSTDADRMQAMPVVHYDYAGAPDGAAADDGGGQRPPIDDIYMTPPLPYADVAPPGSGSGSGSGSDNASGGDGALCVKMGCNTRDEQWLSADADSLARLRRWMRRQPRAPLGDDGATGEERGDGDDDDARVSLAMMNALRGLLPDVSFDAVWRRRCCVSYTPSGYPTVDAVGARVFVAVGGNGSGACVSDALGSLAAGLVRGEAWERAARCQHDDDTLPRGPFRAGLEWPAARDSGGGGRVSPATLRAVSVQMARTS